MATTPSIYQSVALAERIESLQVAPHSFDQATIEARASYVFTVHDPHEELEQCGCEVTLRSNLQYESDYTLADGPVSASSDGVDVALSPRPGRRRLGSARAPAPLAPGGTEGGGGAR